MSEEKWAENWVEAEGEKKLEEALEKLRSLKGMKKQLMIKAVTRYINSMIGESGE